MLIYQKIVTSYMISYTFLLTNWKWRKITALHFDKNVIDMYLKKIILLLLITDKRFSIEIKYQNQLNIVIIYDFDYPNFITQKSGNIIAKLRLYWYLMTQ